MCKLVILNYPRFDRFIGYSDYVPFYAVLCSVITNRCHFYVYVVGVTSKIKSLAWYCLYLFINCYQFFNSYVAMKAGMAV